MNFSDQYTDLQLISQMKNGRVEAFDLLFDRYSQPIYRFSISQLKTREDSEEVVQEVFFRLWESRKQIPDKESFRSYLFSIAYHVIVDMFRKKIMDSKYEKFLHRKTDFCSNETQDSVEFSELDHQLNTIIEELPERRRTIFCLSRKQGLSHKEISSQLNITSKTVENHINLALRFIREKLGEERCREVR